METLLDMTHKFIQVGAARRENEELNDNIMRQHHKHIVSTENLVSLILIVFPRRRLHSRPVCAPII